MRIAIQNRLLIALLALGGTSRAADVTIPHIGRLLKSTTEGEVAVDGRLKMKFGIYKKNVDAQGETATNLIWEETYKSVAVHQGIYTVDLGETSGDKAPIDSDDLAAAPALWLELTMYESDDATEGTVLSPRMRIARVPLAHQSDNASNLGGAPAADYLKKADFDAFKTELSGGASGGGITVPWARLSSIPEGFSDGKDDGLTSVAVSGALTGTGTGVEGDTIKIKDKGVGTSLLDDNSITTEKIVNLAVTSEKLAAGAVGTDQLAAQAVGNGQLKADAVEATQIKNGAVTAGKLGAGAVVAANLATGAVTSAAILDGSIQAADLAAGSLSPTAFSTGSITLDKLSLATAATGGTTCVLGQIPKVNSVGRWECGSDVGAGGTTNTTASGALLLTGLDFTVKPLGITVGYIGNDAVETAKIKDLNVTAAKLASDAAGLLKVTNGNAGVYGTNIGIGLASGITTVGSTLAFGSEAARSVGVERRTASGAGSALTIGAGGAFSGGTDLGGGDLNLSSGLATGAGNSRITFSTAGGGAAGTGDRAVAERMRIDGLGNIGIGNSAPNARLATRGAPAIAVTVTTALSVTAAAPTQISSTAAWAGGLALGDLITLAGGGTRSITGINAAKTVVTVDAAFAGAPLALLAYSYQQPIVREELSSGAPAVTVLADGRVGLQTSAPSFASLQFGNALGNKIGIYDNGTTDRYGFGLNSGNLSAFVPAGGRFSVRQNDFAGTEVFTVGGSGGITTASVEPQLILNSSDGGRTVMKWDRGGAGKFDMGVDAADKWFLGNYSYYLLAADRVTGEVTVGKNLTVGGQITSACASRLQRYEATCLAHGIKNNYVMVASVSAATFGSTTSTTGNALCSAYVGNNNVTGWSCLAMPYVYDSAATGNNSGADVRPTWNSCAQTFPIGGSYPWFDENNCTGVMMACCGHN